MKRLIKRKFGFHFPDFKRKFDFHFPDFNKQASLVFKPMLTIEEASIYVGLPKSLLYRLIKNGDLSYRKDGNRFYISRIDLDLLGTDMRR